MIWDAIDMIMPWLCFTCGLLSLSCLDHFPEERVDIHAREEDVSGMD
jgi:hypothetical protein